MSARLCTAYFALTSMLLPAAGKAATLVVDPTGQGDFTHIQPALDAAAEGDIVLVKPGEYVTADTLYFRASRTTLRSEGGHAVTTIRLAPPPGDATPRFVLNIHDGVLDGFTVTGGTRGAIQGGGAESGTPTPSIVQSVITGNAREFDPTWGGERWGIRRGGAELPPLPAPFAHWSFDEGSGTTAHDGAGDRDASIVGATWTAGRVGQALRFDGVDDYVVVPGVLRFEALSFAAWVQSSTSYLNNRRIITLHDGIDPSYYHFDLEANTRGGPQVYAGSGTVNNYDWTLSPGVWTHLTVTHDGAAGRIYWNGQLIEEGPLAVGYHEGTIFIGGVETPNGAALAWSGLIDEVVVFDRALTAAEVWRLYVDGVR